MLALVLLDLTLPLESPVGCVPSRVVTLYGQQGSRHPGCPAAAHPQRQEALGTSGGGHRGKEWQKRLKEQFFKAIKAAEAYRGLGEGA